MTKVKLTKEQVEFITGMSHQIYDNENIWYHIPFWFKQVGKDEFEVTPFEKLPENVIKIITDMCFAYNDNNKIMDKLQSTEKQR